MRILQIPLLILLACVVDIVITEYCCNNRKKPPSACDLTCGKTFKKVKNVWKLVDTSAPLLIIGELNHVFDVPHRVNAKCLTVFATTV